MGEIEQPSKNGIPTIAVSLKTKATMHSLLVLILLSPKHKVTLSVDVTILKPPRVSNGSLTQPHDEAVILTSTFALPEDNAVLWGAGGGWGVLKFKYDRCSKNVTLLYRDEML